MLDQYWASVKDDGPAFTQHWLPVSCYLGSRVVAENLAKYMRPSLKSLAHIHVLVPDTR